MTPSAFDQLNAIADRLERERDALRAERDQLRERVEYLEAVIRQDGGATDWMEQRDQLRAALERIEGLLDGSIGTVYGVSMVREAGRTAREALRGTTP